MTYPRIIAIYSPLPGSGKTTLAELLVRDYNYTRISFAGPLKEMFKTLLRARGETESRIDWYLNNKSEVIPYYGVTTRFMLQTLGTEWGRNTINKDMWIDTIITRIKRSDPKTHYVIDDLRFESEFDKLPELNATRWKLVNPRIKPVDNRNFWQRLFRRPIQTHSSEMGLEHKTFDANILNNGTVYDLGDMLKLIMDCYNVS